MVAANLINNYPPSFLKGIVFGAEFLFFFIKERSQSRNCSLSFFKFFCFTTRFIKIDVELNTLRNFFKNSSDVFAEFSIRSALQCFKNNTRIFAKYVSISVLISEYFVYFRTIFFVIVTVNKVNRRSTRHHVHSRFCRPVGCRKFRGQHKKTTKITAHKLHIIFVYILQYSKIFSSQRKISDVSPQSFRLQIEQLDRRNITLHLHLMPLIAHPAAGGKRGITSSHKGSNTRYCSYPISKTAKISALQNKKSKNKKQNDHKCCKQGPSNYLNNPFVVSIPVFHRTTNTRVLPYCQSGRAA